jgi:hypothetical protein
VRRTAQYLTGIAVGLIPSLLVLVTLVWMIVRRRGAGPAQTLDAT